MVELNRLVFFKRNRNHDRRSRESPRHRCVIGGVYSYVGVRLRISLEGVAIIIKLRPAPIVPTPLDQPRNCCPRGSPFTLDLNPFSFSLSFPPFSHRNETMVKLDLRSKIDLDDASLTFLFPPPLFSPFARIVSFKCLERARYYGGASIRPTDKSNSPRHEGLPFRQRHNGKCDFSLPL